MPYSPSTSGPGNPEERKYLQTIEAVAKDRGPGIASRAMDAAMFLPKTAWRTLVTYTVRQEAAVAGVLDVLQDTGRKGESTGHRFWREVIGGTKLGDRFGIKPGDKETISTVFEQGGMGEGVSLSDAIGDNWLTKRWDPNARGAAALGTAIATDPFTWATFGAGGIAKIVGKAGVIVATSKATKLAGRLYVKDLVRAGRRAGIDAGDLAKLPKASPAEFFQIEKKVLTHVRDDLGLKSLGGRGTAEAMLVLEREAASRVVDMARGVAGRAPKVRGLDAGSGIRLGSLKWLGFKYGGVKVMDFEKLGFVGAQFGKAIRTGKLGSLPKALYEDVNRLDQVFNLLH